MVNVNTNIAIAGISSKLALRVASALLQRPNVLLRGSCRDISKLSPPLTTNPRVTLIETGPYDTSALRKLVRGCDVVICCYFADNETMTSGQKLLIDLCEENGVPRYLASDYTADYRNLEFGEAAMKDPMKHTMAYLECRENVKGVHVLVGLLMESFWNAFGGWDAEEEKFRYWGSGQEKWEITTYRTAAEYVAAVALDRSAVGVMKCDRKSTFEIADIMESVYGVKPGLENLGSLTECEQRRKIKKPEALVAAAAYFFFSGRAYLGQYLDNSRYPEVRPETFQDFFRSRDIKHVCDTDFVIVLE